MKKILFTTIIFIMIFLGIKVEVQAQSFYEGDFIPGIWMIRKNNQRLIYQSARFIRRSGDGQVAYCIEPFSFIESNQDYQQIIYPENISQVIWDRVNLIAYYGYGYQGHQESKWYPITQIMIWRTIDPNSDFYFTDSLNGNRIEIYTQEMNEIEKLIKQHNIKPSFDNQTINIVLGKQITINDTNLVLTNYEINETNDFITKNGNYLTIYGQESGTKQITFSKNHHLYQTPPILYYNSQSQNLMTVGSPSSLYSNLNINILETEIEITKIDKDSKTAINQGEARLEGATYILYNEAYEEIEILIIQDNKKAVIKNLDFGTYYLKELTPGIGYTLNEEIQLIEITKENPKLKIITENEVIKGKLEIYKKYKEGLPEENINFKILDSENNYVTTITTDSNGYASIILPYGTYYITQLNTTPGFQKVEDFKIIIDENSDNALEYHLNDIEIPVPNTGTTNNLINLKLIDMFEQLYYEKKKYNYFNIVRL